MSKYAKKSIAFSIALDETTDNTDISQLCIWFRAIDEHFNLHTDILKVVGLHS